MGNEWIVERDLVDLLNSTLGMDVFISIAPENAKEPFAVLSTVNIGAVRPLSFFHPLASNVSVTPRSFWRGRT